MKLGSINVAFDALNISRTDTASYIVYRLVIQNGVYIHKVHGVAHDLM